MRRTRRLAAWGTAVAFLAGLAGGCDSMAKTDKATSEVETIATALAHIQIITEARPPADMKGLVEFLAVNGSVDAKCIDYDKGTITDPWGHPYIVLVDGNKCSGLGCAGPDGEWKDGQGDDLFCRTQVIIDQLERPMRGNKK